MRTPIISLKVLPGEPTDGSGKLCIHLLVLDENGPFEEPSVTRLEEVEGQGKKVITKPTRARLACDPKKLVAPVRKNGVNHITLRTGEIDGVTCPKCKESVDYNRLVEIANSNK